MFVGPAVDRRCGEAKLEGVPVGPDDLIASGARLDVKVKNEVVPVPAIPGPGHGLPQPLPEVAERRDHQQLHQLQHHQG